MLFTYPAEALDCNWLNDCIVTTLVMGMDAIDAGGNPAAWPDCLPADKRQALRRQSALKTKLENVWGAYRGLPAGSKAEVRNAIAQQTNIPNLYGDVALACLCMNELPDQIKAVVKDLSEYAFGKLSSLKENGEVLRDVHFRMVQNSGIRVCPFCGLERFQPAGLKRNALDHLMPISRYPFVSSDFRNLPPACYPCNSQYKRDIDVLYDDAGNRRVCSDPYSGPVFTVSLAGSEFEAGNNSGGYKLPRWNINLIGGPAPQSGTWDAVYSIKSRYEAVLDRDFISWIEHFATWLVREDQTARESQPEQIAQQLPRYIENVLQWGFDDISFLKAEAFRMLRDTCNDPDTGIDAQSWLSQFVRYAT